MELLGTYKNGNYTVMLFDTGTKIRASAGNGPFEAAFPESMDVSITNRCDNGCSMCYAGCTPEGKNAEILHAPWLDSLHPYTEMAIGGGNIFEHPDLIPFLELLKEKKVIANITVNQTHFMQHFDQIKQMCDRDLVHGVGISVFYPADELLRAMSQIPHAVAHCIVGVIEMRALEKMFDHDIRLLLLGYKSTGRGSTYFMPHLKEIGDNAYDVRTNLTLLLDRFKVVAFDNLALKQLNVRSVLTGEEWERVYMGDDGIAGELTSASMYIDMVTNTFSYNSMSDKHFPILEIDTPETMYKTLKNTLAKDTKGR